MAIADGTLEYIYTIGVLVSFAGLVIGSILNRKRIGHVLHESGFLKRDLILAIIAVAVFLAIVIIAVKPTQILFFDDAIYQAMGLMLLHTGQAWMCNYGTSTQCFSGQIFHEPIGLSFNIAIGFLLLGSSRFATHAVQVALAAISVFMTFMVAFIMLKDRRAAFFSALAFSVLPIILFWSAPTNSDMATLAYSLISIFMLVVLMRRRSLLSLFNFLLSLSLLLYMKVDALIYIPIFAIMYLALYERGPLKAITESARLMYKNIFNTKLLLIILLFILLAYPTILFATTNAASDGFGYQGSSVQQTCSTQGAYIKASGTINLQNFEANVCSNVLFWANKYTQQQVTQPLYFTILAIIGVILLVVFGKGKELTAIGVWFGIIFLFYTAFYAGSVVFGVDWRFMITLMAPFAILIGYSISGLSRSAEKLVSKVRKHSRIPQYVGLVVAAVLAVSLFYVLYINASTVFLNPTAIQQAGDARFYENFVYNSSSLIPADCLVYTYDPTLFNLVNKSASQLSNLYQAGFYNSSMAKFPCAVLDVGYWCNTPGNICSQAQHAYNLTALATATYSDGFTYGLYRIKN
jgi:hypothetical protein